MTGATLDTTFVETPAWFGPPESPLLGWLTTPRDGQPRGGVLLAPPVGRESRAARFALRALAATLSERGFVTLRFDYHGVGDSSGTVDDADLAHRWVDSVAAAAAYLRSGGLTSISLVGMRLGATIAAVAAVERGLELSAMVLWDPCESGRAYLREMQVLEALRQKDHTESESAIVETMEFAFSRDRVKELRELSLTKLGPGRVAKRVLVITRADRAISEEFRDRFDEGDIEWKITTEQAALINVEPLFAKMPEQTIGEIVEWLGSDEPFAESFAMPPSPDTVVVQRVNGGLAVQERCVEIGPRRLFGVVAEPVGEVRGPLVVLMNVSNEDHTGPSRLWVDLSRRWAAMGLRCVRFDLSGLGDSPFVWGKSVDRIYEGAWLEDIASVAPALAPTSSTDAVYLGLCSGALLSVEAALAVGARGVLAINPPDCMDFLRRMSRLRGSRRRTLRAVGDGLNWAVLHLGPVVTLSWKLGQSLLPKRFVVDVLTEVTEHDVDLQVLVGSQEFSSGGRLAWLRRIVDRRLATTVGYVVDVVPDLDHSMFSARGRDETVARLDQRIRTYLPAE